MIFTSCQTGSQQTLSGLAGVKRESVLAIQVYIESRWLKLFLEWFMSAQTLRGQSKHKATLSNLRHPMLWHSCPNGSGLLRMTMNRVLTELFAQTYIDVKHMPGSSQPPDFISAEHLRDRNGTFHLHQQNAQTDGISHGGGAASHPSNKNQRTLKHACEKREK